MRYASAQKTASRLLAPLVLCLSVLLSAQALGFDVDDFSYVVINTTDDQVTGTKSSLKTVHLLSHCIDPFNYG